MDLVKSIDCYPMVPDEIFIHIFRLLPSEDRKSLRLTCHRFYELCNSSVLESAEVIVLRGNYNTDAALQCLSTSSRRIQNIKLYGVRVKTETIRPFFEQHGSHMRSVNFIRCRFDHGAMKIIIELCVHLRHFAVNCFFSDSWTILNDFEEMVNKSIVRDCVTDFSFIVSSVPGYVRDKKILHFFDVFPRISKLHLDIRIVVEDFGPNHCEDCWPQLSDRSRNSPYLFPSLYDRLLAMADQLEVLNLRLNSPEKISMDIFNIRMKNLKQLSIPWSYDLRDNLSIYCSSLFEQLTHFSCSIDRCRDQVTTYLIVRSLLEFTPLQSLTIADDCRLLDCDLFTALVKSKLETLEIRISRSAGSTWIRDLENSETTLMPNYCLQHLALEGCDHNLTLLFATYFRGAKQLKFLQIEERVLQNIFKDQTNVRSLQLINRPIDGVFREVSHFQDWLRKEKNISRELKYLTELRITESEFSLTSFLLSEFVFPKLKSVYICIGKINEHDADQLYHHLVSKLTQLQSLSLNIAPEFTYAQWSAICKSLSKLRHFYVQNFGTFLSLSEYEQLFDESPSLRAIKHKAWSNGTLSERHCKYFIYDVIKKTVFSTTRFSWNDDSHSFWEEAFSSFAISDAAW